MEKELVTLEEVEQSVKKLTKFEITAAQLKDMVAKSQNITVSDLKDKAQLEIVKRNRIDLRKAEIAIEKAGKSYRDVLNKANDHILQKQRELTSITTPEIERLEAIEAEAEAIRIKEERLERLPARKERLAALLDGIEVSDEELLALDGTQFEAYFNKRTAEKLAADKKALEEEQRKAREAAEAEKRRIADEAAEQKRRQDAEVEAKRKAEQDRIDKENARIEEEKRKIEREKLEIAHQKELATAKEQARINAEKEAKARAEQERLAAERAAQEAKEEQERQAALRPDKIKLLAFADQLDALVLPEVSTKKGEKVLENIKEMLGKISKYTRDNLK